MYLFCFNLFVNFLFIYVYLCVYLFIHSFIINLWDWIIESFQHWFMNKSFGLIKFVHRISLIDLVSMLFLSSMKIYVWNDLNVI